MQIVGHRGAAGHAPENTLTSFRKAIELGCHAVEMDVHLSKDGVALVIHDAKAGRVTDGRGKIRKMTLAQLKALRCPQGERLPTLQEAIDVCKGKIKMYIELKAKGTAETVATIIKENGIENDVVILSFKIGLLRRIKHLNPRLKIVYLFFRKPFRLWRLVKSMPLDFVGPRVKATTAKLVNRAHASGCGVYAFGADDVLSASRMVHLNVDAVCTDFPTLFLEQQPRRH